MSEQLRDVSDTRFGPDVLQSDQPVLVDFWAEWCGPCRMMTPVVEKVADKFQGVAKVYKLNVDDNPSVSQRFGIKGIPTMIVFKDGKEAERIVGATSEKAITSLIEAQLKTVGA